MSFEKELWHYGTPRHSGRYPWGSGDNPYQRNADFRGQVYRLKKEGVSEVDIAKGFGMSTSELRKELSKIDRENRAYMVSQCEKLREKGMSPTAIAKRLGINESSVRSYLNANLKEKAGQTKVNADILADAVAEKGYIDVGAGVEQFMGISQHKLDSAVEMLKEQGYKVYDIKVEQLGTGKETTIKTLCPPDTTFAEAFKNRYDIQMVTDVYSEDGGATMTKLETPRSIDSDRVMIRYAEDGGIDKDGVIELRRNVPELSLNEARYAQVRIAVDGTRYLKGMAMYGDSNEFPPGVDIIFNTNKTHDVDKMDVLKKMALDNPENPFGATIKDDDKLVRAQRHYIDENGERQLSALNIVNEEGTWNDYHKTLAAQFLSKQSPALAEKQLNLSYDIAKDEFNEIMSLTQPTVRSDLLNQFASKCDSDATHLNAAALPRQTTKVLLPIPDMKDNQVYAPGYKDGESIALVRFPHGGKFEIPILEVNNKQATGRATIGDAIDAVGINKKNADRLSGADFDGDNVLCIPLGSAKIQNINPSTNKYLKDLSTFDPKTAYKGYEGMHVMTDREKGIEMGSVSNLITDMTIKGAPIEDIVKAVKHSMVVIDAKKHELDYKKSAIDNDIAKLKKEYQGGERAGGSTIISRSTSEIRVDARKKKALSKMTPEEKERYYEGYEVYEKTGKTFSKAKKNSEGEVIGYTKELRKDKLPKMQTVDDAYDLVSRGKDGSTTRIETIYAKYANSMKELARKARSIARRDKDIEYNPSSAKFYANEVKSLVSKLALAKKNAPLERQAQLIANKEVKTIFYNNPDLDEEHRKRVKGQALDKARKRVGAKKQTIDITDREWEAINAGAVSPSRLKEIISNSNPDRVKSLAMPRSSSGMSSAKVARAKSLLSNGHTQSDVAEMLGVSVSTLVDAVGKENM